jgi:hypothetical protein
MPPLNPSSELGCGDDDKHGHEDADSGQQQPVPHTPVAPAGGPGPGGDMENIVLPQPSEALVSARASCVMAIAESCCVADIVWRSPIHVVPPLCVDAQ